ncbi:DUF4150 domain-containing protein [Paraburkholderia sp. DHOC27]|uniref:DUF4150 domain-containing protein n=1 Tax=Paraburkholderia sp. DHOC27 TaxID=2303330 RepID=UPI000E3B5DBF|nr:DUF4150 domain-containing protein [Paraburkholderia sp. DHOC27]RFU49781.1 DUF4150 domain-containing protein [Paraburkholderia sp. DHOC27]
MGFAKSTLPDVCKTPTPGGPVPVPYPIIVSTSSDLAHGTTTVTVDGGNMAAIKGSELSRCTGDEAGTAGGGVKSSTFMKEASWLLYSFDVKFEGQNACRLSDKMLMNHGNTACLGGFIQSPVPGTGEVVLECDPTWDECQKAQMRAKAREMNNGIASQGGSTTLRKPSPKNVAAAERAQARYANNWNKDYVTGKFSSPDQEPCNQPTQFYHSCAKEKADGDPLGANMQADHVMEKQMVGGRADGPFRWLDASVNGSSGSQIKAVRKKYGNVKVTKFRTSGC